MFFLVRKSVLGGVDEFQDLDFEGNELIIGNNNNCTLSLDELDTGSLVIKPKNTTKAKFNCTQNIVITQAGKDKSTGNLIQGQIYHLGIFDLEVINPPAGFDFAISLIHSKRKSVATKRKYKIESEKSIFSIRLLSYIVFATIIALFLFVPLFGSHKTMSKIPLPSDVLWSSGPMAMAHRIPEIGDDCKVCHVKPFEKVPDKQCLSCHSNLGEHVAENHPAIDELGQFLCENCHKEHNEPTQLTRTDDALCIECHQEIEKFTDRSSTQKNDIQSVNGFNSSNHPQFRLGLIQPFIKNGAYEWELKRPRFDLNTPAIEQSNLKFSHQIHLDVEMVQDEQTGDALGCKSCHQLQRDKEHFKPITMDKDCRSCHKLTFDVFNPDLELPHGDLRAAAVMLEAHFIREFTDPDLRLKRSNKKKRRIPGKHTNNANCEGNGLNCGRAEALKEAEFQFTNSGCITCHEVTENNTTDPLSKWFVKPIRITGDWYSKAKFDHVSHFSIRQGNDNEICLTCHNVKTSEVSSDVAMPGRDICLECHQQDKHNSVELSCIRCHVFHFTDFSESIKPK